MSVLTRMGCFGVTVLLAQGVRLEEEVAGKLEIAESMNSSSCQRPEVDVRSIPSNWQHCLGDGMRDARCLGAGTFGTVFGFTVTCELPKEHGKLHSRDPRKPTSPARPAVARGVSVAVKLQKIQDAECQAAVRREFALITYLNKNYEQPPTLPLLRANMDTVSKHPGIAASMQPLAAGDAQDLIFEIHDARNIPSTILNVLKLLVTADIISGMRQQIESFVRHNDIKPPNFLVTCSGGALQTSVGSLGGSFARCNTANLRTYYADYGLACSDGGTADTACPGFCGSMCGTPGWIPPEELSRGKNFKSPEGDLWAVGEMLYYVWFGQHAPFSSRSRTVVLPTPDRRWVHPSRMTTQTGLDHRHNFNDRSEWQNEETLKRFTKAPSFAMENLPPVLDLFGLRQDISDLMAALLGPAAQRVTVAEDTGRAGLNGKSHREYQDIMDRIVWQAQCIRVLRSGSAEAIVRELKTMSRNAKIAAVKARIRPGRSTSDDGHFMAGQGCGLAVGSHEELEELLKEAEAAYKSLMKEAREVERMKVNRIYDRAPVYAARQPQDAGPQADKPWWEALGLDGDI
eukprot:CAMPEP_0197630564 /NCGR_PEP_ID=MMETSP1338-20131121/8005_1 /TAXON_ID=43686 ORGANISM="Pelagodinium beii, Strain RCC1491" /NCGR_SAMPLE_ID=MMETSP1338 /ASSEMBLY_ACC=CAM_ASM_000754 /LENGTH=571 /DNA_ID=CAMNT_0043201803 /DNA_START=53 /DNA_END=1768 /DNA_ORIENTATION=-